MSLAELNTLYAAAVAAMDAGDYDLAIRKLMAIQARLITSPQEVTKGVGGGGRESLVFGDPATIDTLIARCERLKTNSVHATSGPWRQVPVTYARPGLSEDYA